jgi:hypothetical protein
MYEREIRKGEEGGRRGINTEKGGKAKKERMRVDERGLKKQRRRRRRRRRNENISKKNIEGS